MALLLMRRGEVQLGKRKMMSRTLSNALGIYLLGHRLGSPQRLLRRASRIQFHPGPPPKLLTKTSQRSLP